MPRLCLLAGIVIWVNTRDHLPPHFHARFSGAEVRVNIADLSVLTGALPRAKERVLMQWAAVHQDELMRNWELARNGQPHEPIAPPRPRRPEMSHPVVDVTEVVVLDAQTVRVTFSDGVVKTRDLTPLLWGPVFDQIRTDACEFARVRIDPELGVLCWPNEADLDSEMLRYDDLWEQSIALARTA